MLGSIDGFLHLHFKRDSIDVDLGNLAFYGGDFYFVVYAIHFIFVLFHLFNYEL